MADGKKRFQFIWATGPKGNRARFDSPGDVPTEWIVDGDKEPLHKRTKPVDPKAKK